MNDLGLAIDATQALPLPPVTVGDAFRQALDGLFRSTKRKPNELAETAGLSSATISRLRNGERTPSFEVLEQLRVAFNVAAADLFIPRVVDVQGRPVDREEATKRHTILASAESPALASRLPQQKEAPLMAHPDHELLGVLVGYWDVLTTKQRLELLALGHDLRGQPGGQPSFARR